MLLQTWNLGGGRAVRIPENFVKVLFPLIGTSNTFTENAGSPMDLKVE